ncbi:hypothetical protein [Nocardia stercoris]|uniref:Uncharacterized protein n=1 Tax=Nocardia stercoris TaxID=2483361 RepID=A0A3M2LAE4_9NOCA|nr:hypothetical protein [Nocardia stercoris]RMI33533.1 hypothetical protein EBN03_10480 [Nocardia stercoris]
MDATTPCETQSVEIDHMMLHLECAVWWSPADSAYVAVDLHHAPFIHSDPRSAQAAIDGLESAVRAHLLSASRRAA